MDGFEILKRLPRAGPEHKSEWIPIVENADNTSVLSQVITQILLKHPKTHCVLVRKRGLYSWGASIAEATRHVETFEVVCEVRARQLHVSGGN
jgi:methylthioribulose-1-phosphate dehydratase